MDGAFIFQGGEIRFRAVKAGITSVRHIAGMQKDFTGDCSDSRNFDHIRSQNGS